MPVRIAMEPTLQGGRSLNFARSTASSATGRIVLRCLTPGVSLTLEVATALLLLGGLGWLGRVRPAVALGCTLLLLSLVVVLRLGATPFQPHVMTGAWALLALAVVLGARLLWRRLTRRGAVSTEPC